MCYLRNMAASDEPTGKIDVGTWTEDEVTTFVAAAFSPDFVFRSPQHLDGKLMRETSDVLVIWDDVAIAIECKSRALHPDGTPQADDVEWTRTRLRKALSQLGGAVKTVKSGRIVRLQNERRGVVSFSTDMFRYVYALAIMNHDAAPYYAEDLVPDEIAAFPVPVHVLSFRDFYNLCLFLDTPAELVNYLELRNEVLRPTLAPRVHEEQPAFECFIDRFEQFHVFRTNMHGVERTESQFKEGGDFLRNVYRNTGAKEDLVASSFVDSLIDVAHQVDLNLVANPDAYIEVATYLSRMARVRRVYIGKACLDAVDRAVESGDTEFEQFSSELRSECFVFLASPLPQERRAERIRDLELRTALLRLTRGVRRALGVATEGSAQGRSFDFVMIENDAAGDAFFPNRDEAIAYGLKLYGRVRPR